MGNLRQLAGGEQFSRRVLVVEDQPLIRKSLVLALEAAGYDVSEAPDAALATALFRESDPDGLVMDIDLGEGPSGLDLLDAIRLRNPAVPAVIVTRLSDPRLAGSGLKPDPITAFINKQTLSDPSRVVDALSAVITGSAGDAFRDDIEAGRPKLGLTNVQIEVLELVAEGLTNEQIASDRGISARAVQRTLSRAFAVMGIEAGPGQDPRVLAVRAYMDAIGLLPRSGRGMTGPE